MLVGVLLKKHVVQSFSMLYLIVAEVKIQGHSVFHVVYIYPLTFYVV